jgi:hypothetical protein
MTDPVSSSASLQLNRRWARQCCRHSTARQQERGSLHLRRLAATARRAASPSTASPRGTRGKWPSEPESESKCMQYVLVVAADRRPLMPCRPARARLLLQQGKAAVLRRYPFVLILKDAKPAAVITRVRLKIDPGSQSAWAVHGGGGAGCAMSLLSSAAARRWLCLRHRVCHALGA